MSLQARDRALDAAALQDQLLRRMHMKPGVNPLSRPRRPRVRRNKDERWSCSACNGVNPGRDSYCTRCGIERAVQTKLTMAQMRGFERLPAPKLCSAEWGLIEARAQDRGDFGGPCPICQDRFKQEHQVILCCSHVFHEQCLASLEKFLGDKERACPLCRKMRYQRKLTRLGTLDWHRCCVVKLQSFVRGCIQRCMHHQRLKSLYGSPHFNGDARRKRAFLCKELGHESARLAKSIESESESLDDLFAEIEQGLSYSRRVLGGQQAQATTAEGGRPCQAAAGAGADNNDEARKWEAAWASALRRGEKECPICMNSVVTSTRSLRLTSCSHVFCHSCLDAFETFNKGQEEAVPVCPVCRSEYDSIGVEQLLLLQEAPKHS